MLRRGTGDPKTMAPSLTIREGIDDDFGKGSTSYPGQRRESTTTSIANDPCRKTAAKPLRGLLRMLQGQIPPDTSTPHGYTASSGASSNPPRPHEAATVTVCRYHGPTLRETQTWLQKKKRKPKHAHTNEKNRRTLLPHSSHTTSFCTAVRRHKFVAFFVVQGWQTVAGNRCYSAHTLNLRTLLATEYHDVLTTFVLDLGSGNSSGSTLVPSLAGFDEETGSSVDDNESKDAPLAFCRGTGFGVFPTTPFSASTVFALLNVTKIPSIVVLDASTGRVVAGDAILALERNDSHTVVNRWQAGKPGLSILQQLGAVATCECSHGPCCGGSGGGSCCVIQ